MRRPKLDQGRVERLINLLLEAENLASQLSVEVRPQFFYSSSLRQVASMTKSMREGLIKAFEENPKPV